MAGHLNVSLPDQHSRRRTHSVSVFTRYLQDKRPGVLKYWDDSPVRLHDWHLSDIYNSVEVATGYGPRVEVNGQTLHIGRPDYARPGSGVDWSPVSQAAFDPRFAPIRSVSFHGDVTVFLGPRAVYACALMQTTKAEAALFEIQRILVLARRQPGHFLLRSWGAALTTGCAFILATLVFQPATRGRLVSVLAIAAAMLVYLVFAAYVGLFRRVRIEANLTRQQARFWKRNADSLTVGLLVTVVGGLTAAAVVALAGNVK